MKHFLRKILNKFRTDKTANDEAYRLRRLRAVVHGTDPAEFAEFFGLTGDLEEDKRRINEKIDETAKNWRKSLN